MDKRLYAVIAILLGLVIGFIGDLFFYQHLLGLSVPLYTGICAAVLFGFAAFARRRPQIRNLWLLLPIAFFAIMVAISADQTLTILNILAVLTLTALLLHYFPLQQTVGHQHLLTQVAAVLESAISVALSPINQLIDSIGWLRSVRARPNKSAAAVLRGLVIAIPVLIVFGMLLASADQIFARAISQFRLLIDVRDLDSAITHAGVIGFVGWAACGALAYAVLTTKESRDAPPPPPATPAALELADAIDSPSGKPSQPPQPPQPAQSAAPAKPVGRIGMIEAGIVLGLVNLLFITFVFIQFAYFFGGEANITAAGLTYADYARRGFFELVAVSLLALGLMLWLEQATDRKTSGQRTLFRVLAAVMVALVGVMLWSAHLRLSLYEEAYGFTHLRLYPHLFMAWLAVLFGFFVLTLLRPQRGIFSLGVMLCAIGILATLNLINPDHTIMQQNIARYRNGYPLDVGYLRYVSADAIPVMLELYQESEDEVVRYPVGQWLVRQLQMLDVQRGDRTILSAHASRDNAWLLLDAARDELPAHDPDFRLPSFSEFYRE